MLTAAKHSLVAFLISASVLATPVPDMEEIQDLATRGSILTGPVDSESVANGLYVLENNLWGESAATSGSQSSQVIATSGNQVTWQTSYDWVGNSKAVKSFANLDLRLTSWSLASISSMPTSWQWSYQNASSNLEANVAYDMWLSNNAGSRGANLDSTYEVMVWLSARGGATPSGSQIATASINGVSWMLYKGTGRNWTIFTFKPFPPNEITNFSSDLKPFFTYLTASQGIPSSQFLVQMQAGTEPFVGSATLTSSYSAAIN